MTRDDVISRQAAINAIENTKSAKSEDGEIYIAKINAEMNIQLLPSVTPQPCEDVISRTAVLNTLDTMDKALDENRTVEEYKELLRECYEQLPSVSVTEKTGHWIYNPETDLANCSNCGASCPSDKYGRIEVNDCPNCGTKMEVEE